MRNRNGFALTEVTIAGTIGALLFLGYHANLASISRATTHLTHKVIAQNYASETIEKYSGLTPAQMGEYLPSVKETFPICPLIPGDFNRDGKVNDLDNDVLKTSPARGWGLPADANFDGVVNINDRNIWLANRNRESACGRPHCPRVSGDYDGNGTVSEMDVVVWQEENAKLKPQMKSPADGNRDGRVDTSDYNLILDHKGSSSSCGAAVESAILSQPKSYRLCEVINPETGAVKGPYYFDQTLALPSLSGLQNANRSMTVQIVDLETLVVNQSKCGQSAESAIPDPTETYLVKTEVSWGSDKVDRIFLSALLTPDSTPAGNGGGPSAPCQLDKQMTDAQYRDILNLGTTPVPDQNLMPNEWRITWIHSTQKIVHYCTGGSIQEKDAIYFHQPSADRACRCMGYGSAQMFNDNPDGGGDGTGFDSPGNNELVFWNGANWEWREAKDDNRWIGELICSAPICR